MKIDEIKNYKLIIKMEKTSIDELAAAMCEKYKEYKAVYETDPEEFLEHVIVSDLEVGFMPTLVGLFYLKVEESEKVNGKEKAEH